MCLFILSLCLSVVISYWKKSNIRKEKETISYIKYMNEYLPGRYLSFIAEIDNRLTN